MFRIFALLAVLGALLPLPARAQDFTAYIEEDVLILTNLEGQIRDMRGSLWPEDPEWSRDGRYLAWVASDDCAGLLLYNSATGEETSLCVKNGMRCPQNNGLKCPLINKRKVLSPSFEPVDARGSLGTNGQAMLKSIGSCGG